MKGNIVVGIAAFPGQGIGISASGIVSGNYVAGTRFADYIIGPGSTVIGNTAVGNPGRRIGIEVSCPSNVTDNTSTGSKVNLLLDGDGCNNTNNVAP